MQTSKPLVSVTMPVYNCEKYLEESIRSALDQPYDNIEIIAVDDCSRDGSLALLTRLSEEDPRIRVFQNSENKGVIPTRNETIRQSRGKYIAFLDSDDISLPRRFELQVQFMENNSRIGIVGSNATIIDGNGQATGEMIYPESAEQIKAKSLLFQPFRQSALMIRRECFDEVGLFDESNILDDYAFYFRVAQRWGVENIQEILVEYRIHDSNITIYKQKKLLKEILKIKRMAIFEYNYRVTPMVVASYLLTWSMLYLPSNTVLWISNKLRKYA